MNPNFDEIVGAEPNGGERERLRRVHELLVLAGPPPELSPELQAGPTLAMTLGHSRRRPTLRPTLLLAAALAVAVAFFAGYSLGNPVATGRTLQTVSLRGTAAAPLARASLAVLPASAGNFPMTLHVTGLPKLPPRSFYEVYLVRDGKPWGSCGTFVVRNSGQVVSLTLNAPYRLRPSDSWIVIREGPGSAPGQTVLKPVV